MRVPLLNEGTAKLFSMDVIVAPLSEEAGLEDDEDERRRVV